MGPSVCRFLSNCMPLQVARFVILCTAAYCCTQESWESVNSSSTDVKELIPEFYLPGGFMFIPIVCLLVFCLFLPPFLPCCLQRVRRPTLKLENLHVMSHASLKTHKSFAWRPFKRACGIRLGAGRWRVAGERGAAATGCETEWSGCGRCGTPSLVQRWVG